MFAPGHGTQRGSECSFPVTAPKEAVSVRSRSRRPKRYRRLPSSESSPLTCEETRGDAVCGTQRVRERATMGGMRTGYKFTTVGTRLPVHGKSSHGEGSSRGGPEDGFVPGPRLTRVRRRGTSRAEAVRTQGRKGAFCPVLPHRGPPESLRSVSLVLHGKIDPVHPWEGSRPPPGPPTNTGLRSGFGGDESTSCSDLRDFSDDRWCPVTVLKRVDLDVPRTLEKWW